MFGIIAKNFDLKLQIGEIFFRNGRAFWSKIAEILTGNDLLTKMQVHLPRWVMHRGSPSKSETLSEFSSHGQ